MMGASRKSKEVTWQHITLFREVLEIRSKYRRRTPSNSVEVSFDHENLPSSDFRPPPLSSAAFARHANQ